MKPRLLVLLLFNSRVCLGMINELVEDSTQSSWTGSSVNATSYYYKEKRTTFGIDDTSDELISASGNLVESSSFEMYSETSISSEQTTLYSETSISSEQTTFYSETSVSSEQMTSSMEANPLLSKNSIPEEHVTSPSLIDPCYNFGNCDTIASYIHHFCECDDNCTLFNDCCVDADNKNQGQNKYTPHIECYKGHTFRNFEGFVAVVSCPTAHDNSSERLMCEETNIVRDGPAVVGPDGMVFKNKYCALCHGINNVQSFHVSFIFQVSSTLHRFIQHIANFSKIEKLEYLFGKTQHMEVPPLGANLRKCMLHTFKNKDDELCLAYSNPVYKRGWSTANIYYRNYFCAPETIRNSTYCVGRNYDRLASKGRWGVYPMTVMFAFKTSGSNNFEESCDVWSKRLEEEGRCTEKERVSNFSYTFKFIKLASNKPLPSNYVSLVASFYGLSLEIDNKVELIQLQYLGVENESLVLIKRLEVLIRATMFEDEVKNLNDRFEKMHWRMYIKDDNLGYDTIITKERMKIYSEKASAFDVYENETGVRVIKLQGGSRSKFKEVIPKNEKVCDNVIVKVLIRNSTDINVTDVTCKYQSHLTYDVTFLKTITTYICFAISVVSLVVLIILYRKLGMATSIPGSNLENISVSLILSKVLFMVGIGWSDIRDLCYVIGVLLHFVWLSTFYFMSVSVLCIVNNLTKMQSNGQNRKDTLNSKKRCLTLGGLFFPLLFICPAILLDVYGDEYFSAGYGTEPCFPNHFPSNLMFFSGPVMLSIAINFICLMKVICTIGRLSREIGHISTSTPFTNAIVYIRVLILSGLFWIIGILTAFFENEWIGFLFTILCGLQGFFITIASLTTKRVIRDLRLLKQSTDPTINSSNLPNMSN